MSSLTRSRTASTGSIKHNGREMVNHSLFAERMNISHQIVTKLVKNGILHSEPIKGYTGRWLDWEMSKAAYNRMKRTEKRGGKRQADIDRQAFFQIRKVKGANMTTPSDRLPDIEIAAVSSEALVGFDPEAPENADCWEYDESGNAVTVPSTGKHFIDWKKAIDKCMAKIRNQQYLEKEGSLIPKEDVVRTLSEIFPPLSSAIMQIPDRYGSRLQGSIEDMLGKSMTNEQKTLFKSVLEDESVSICRNLQDAIAKVLEAE